MSVVIPQDVIDAAQSAQQATAIPSSVTIAQWAVESGWGAKYTGTFNCFGIKAVDGQPFTSCPTHEVINGERVSVNANFANYASLTEAFVAHDQLLAENERYAEARSYLPDVSAFVAHMAPVYATDPNYASLLMQIITQHELERFDANA